MSRNCLPVVEALKAQRPTAFSKFHRSELKISLVGKKAINCMGKFAMLRQGRRLQATISVERSLQPLVRRCRTTFRWRDVRACLNLCKKLPLDASFDGMRATSCFCDWRFRIKSDCRVAIE